MKTQRSLATLAVLAAAAFASPAVAQTQCIANVAAQGTSDAITSAMLPCGTTTNLVILTAAAANVTTTPTYAPVGSPPLPIVNSNKGPIQVGDIRPSYVALLTSTGSSWVLLNPYHGIAGSSSLTPGASVIAPSTPGGVLSDNAGVLADSTALPSGLTIPSPNLTGTIEVGGNVMTFPGVPATLASQAGLTLALAAALPSLTTSQLYGGTGAAGAAQHFPAGTNVEASLGVAMGANGGMAGLGTMGTIAYDGDWWTAGNTDVSKVHIGGFAAASGSLYTLLNGVTSGDFCHDYIIHNVPTPAGGVWTTTDDYTSTSYAVCLGSDQGLMYAFEAPATGVLGNPPVFVTTPTFVFNWLTGAEKAASLVLGAGSAITSSGPGGAMASGAFASTGTTGATIPLNNGGFTQSGAAIYSGTLAETDAALPAVAAGSLGLAGGPTTAPTLGANDEGDIYLATVNGLVHIGKGSTYDVSLLDSAGSVALGVSTGTLNLVLGGGVTAASLATPSSNIAGTICATSAGVFLYNAGANCYAGGGTAGGSTTQVQVNTSGSLAGITGVTSNGTAMTFADGDAILSGSGSGSSALHTSATGGGAITFQAGAHTVASTTLQDQTLSGGATVTAYNPTAGNVTVDCGKSPLQYILNTGAFIITAPTSVSSNCALEVINGTTATNAGAVTLTNFSGKSPAGATFATTATISAGTCSYTSSSANITWTASTTVLPIGSMVFLVTSGSLPTNFAVATIYYVVSNSGTVVTVAATPGGTPIVAGSAGSGTQTCYEPSVYDLVLLQIDGPVLATWVPVQ